MIKMKESLTKYWKKTKQKQMSNRDNVGEAENQWRLLSIQIKSSTEEVQRKQMAADE